MYYFNHCYVLLWEQKDLIRAIWRCNISSSVRTFAITKENWFILSSKYTLRILRSSLFFSHVPSTSIQTTEVMRSIFQQAKVNLSLTYWRKCYCCTWLSLKNNKWAMIEKNKKVAEVYNCKKQHVKWLSYSLLE